MVKKWSLGCENTPVEHGVCWAAVVGDDGSEGAEGGVAQLGQRLQPRQVAVDHVQVLQREVSLYQIFILGTIHV